MLFNFIFYVNAYAQTNIIYHDTLINQIDSNGIKNGLWIEFANPQLVTVSNIISRGYYKENKKVGLWYYYYQSDYTGLSSIVEYFSNGSLIEMFGDNKIFINEDSSEIKLIQNNKMLVVCKRTKAKYYICKYYQRPNRKPIIKRKNTFDECYDFMSRVW